MSDIEHLKNKGISALFYSFGGLIANSGLQFAIGIFLARLLTPQDYGLLGMITIFIAISQLFVDGGMTTALIREPKVTNEDYSTVFYYNLVFSLVMYGILFLASNSISSFFNEPQLVLILKVVGLNIIIGSFGLIQRTMLIKQLNFKTQTKVDIIAIVISGTVAIFLAYNGYGVWALVFQQIIRQIIISILFIIHNNWKPLLVFNVSSFKRFFNFGWKMLLTGLLATLYNNINNIIIGRVYNPTQLGYYTKARDFSNLPANSITTATSKVVYPLLSSLQEDKVLFNAGFKKIIKNLSFLTFPIMIGLIAVAQPLILLLFGENWLPIVPYFQILCFSGTTMPHRSVNLNVLQVVGRSDLFLKIDIIKIIVGLLSVGVVVLCGFGIYGLLWANFFNCIFAFFTNSFFSKKYISYSTKEQLKDMFPAFFCAMLMGVIVYLFGMVYPFGVISKLLLQIVIGFFIYILFSMVLRIKELGTMYEILSSGLKKIKKRE